jgi:hypothetical protein
MAAAGCRHTVAMAAAECRHMVVAADRQAVPAASKKIRKNVYQGKHFFQHYLMLKTLK